MSQLVSKPSILARKLWSSCFCSFRNSAIEGSLSDLLIEELNSGAMEKRKGNLKGKQERESPKETERKKEEQSKGRRIHKELKEKRKERNTRKE